MTFGAALAPVTFTHRFGDFSSHDLTIHPGQEDVLLLVPSFA